MFLHVNTRRGGGVGHFFCKGGAQTKFIPLAESGVSKRRPKAGDANAEFCKKNGEFIQGSNPF